MNANRPSNVTLGQFTISFVPAGLLIIAALLIPEGTRELEINRTRYTIWSTTLLLAPALVLYLFRSVSQAVANLAHIYWCFAWVIYLIHAAWAVILVFDGVTDTFRQQGLLIAGINFFLTGLWTLDVLLVWWVHSPSRQLILFRLVTRCFVFLVFAVTMLFLREGPVWWLGVAFTTVVLASFVLRLLATNREPATATA